MRVRGVGRWGSGGGGGGSDTQSAAEKRVTVATRGGGRRGESERGAALSRYYMSRIQRTGMQPRADIVSHHHYGERHEAVADER